MVVQSCIILNRLSYIANDQPLFSELNLTFSRAKYGVVGRNGIGKSTLIKLIAGELSPSSGSIQIIGKIAYAPQQLQIEAPITVAEILGIAEQLQALQRISQGSLDEADFTLVGDDWLLAERVTQQLNAFDLAHITLQRQFNSLSGGEQTRLLLAKVFLSGADYLILDEPTNNLDRRARAALYQAIQDWPGGLLIIAHDRELLNLMDHIVELSTLGVNIYGGNYAAYREQKDVEQQAAQQTLQSARQQQQKAQQLIQQRHERHERAQAKGRQARKSEIKSVGRLCSRIEMNSAKGRSEKTQRKINLQAENKSARVNETLQAARQKIETNRELKIDLIATRVPKSKMVLEIKNLTFCYPDHSRPIIENFSYDLQGPQRVALCGENGTGKTTFIKLIQGDLLPTAGTINCGVSQVSYLDQQVQIINPELSVLDNFLKLNPDIRELDARYHLAAFLFRNEAALKLGKNLSSGERLRAGLACILMSKHPPQLLILDEPTNHLDLDSIASIEWALQNYQGALLVISHDQVFLDNIGVEHYLTTPLCERIS